MRIQLTEQSCVLKEIGMNKKTHRVCIIQEAF